MRWTGVKAGEWWPIQRCRRSTFMPDAIGSEAHVWRSVWKPTAEAPRARPPHQVRREIAWQRHQARAVA
jgi:hypothetical protein